MALPSLLAALAGPPVMLPEDANTNILMLLRWIHLLAGITWIGLLYFFNLVNVPFMKQVDAGMKPKVFEHLTRPALWWFRWGAVVTVLAGITYWMMIGSTDASNGGASPATAFGSFFAIWIAVFAIEYVLIKMVGLDKGPVLAVVMIVLVGGASWLFLYLNSHGWESNRLLSIGIGGGMGLVMLLNVWGIIWPNNKKVINGALAGSPPADAAKLGRQAFLASRTNAFLSIPMLFFMAAASHYPMFTNITTRP
ncbi:MAG: urate hydroxylase PuuD [Terriglobales bacterium]